MAIYTDAKYRVGFQGYFAYGAQAAAICTPQLITDPAAQTAGTIAGPCALPGVDTSHNVRPLEAIGAGKAQYLMVGRRDHSLRTQIMVADGAFLAYAIRSHSGAVGAGTRKGLQLLTCEVGTDVNIGDAIADNAIDCLINSLRIEYAEGQPMTADIEIWPTIIVPQTTPKTAPAAPGADVLLWQHCTWTVGSTDYKPILSRASFSINNSLQRNGIRPHLADVTSVEPALSRAAYSIEPGIEQVQVSYTLKDRLPAALREVDDWGTVTMRAEQPGTGAGRRFAQIVLSHAVLNRHALGQTPAGQMLSWSVDQAGYTIAITSGVTSS